MKSRKAQMVQDALVNTIFYVALILILAFIVWALVSGKANSLWESIVEKLRFF